MHNNNMKQMHDHEIVKSFFHLLNLFNVHHAGDDLAILIQ